MQSTPRTTRSSVLGKRSHQADGESSPMKPVDAQDDPADAFALNTPDSSPCAKRPRTSITVFDPRGNKENIPPFHLEDVLAPSLSSPRALRRANSELSTPTRPRIMSRRHGSTSNVSQPGTPSSSLSLLAIQTPPATPTTTLPLHTRARALLRTTCNSAGDIAGRISEAESLRSFITAFIRAKDKCANTAEPVLYISGSPGCGKTALTNSVLASLENDTRDLGVRLLFINCMAFSGMDAVWDRLLTDLGGPKKRTKKVVTSELVQELFQTGKFKCLLVLDEVDHVATSAQTLSRLFSLAQNCSSNLRIIGIANTHTLTSSSSSASMAGIVGVKTLHFSPYEPQQLVDILRARLRPLAETPPEDEALKKFLPLPTLKLLSMKIASQTGDVRAVFEVLRSAIDIAIAQAAGPRDVTPPVTPAHIQAALKAYAPATHAGSRATSLGSSKTQCNSEMVAKISNLGLHSRLVLLALLVACKRSEAGLATAGSRTSSPTTTRPMKRTSSAPAFPTNTASIEMNQLHALYITMLTRDDGDIFTPVSRSEFTDLVNVLETVGLVECPTASPITPTKRKLARSQSYGGASGKSQDIAFTEGVRAAEVLRGLGIDGDTPTLTDGRLEEEAAAMWSRELARIRKEAKKQTPKKTGAVVGFNDATED
ncbi:P-loop containing nucleoside triphosphate hydrolase protein [Vararia minispora EC-137]|uniref:P-loop containing nucleoside triphosphate hydrolase protein n=1 Tax=Vararia minispora EC-137 TaxID=1314806 RepID=A0ACB8QGL8_9AGAM|nr:P-loop containing nucleoside triphosphate hydrolase protein [Vararia minispora EC-137]